MIEAPQPPKATTPFLHSLHPVYRLILRWSFIAIVTVLAFHETIDRTIAATAAGAMGSYVWIVPVVAVMAAQGVARRRRTELPIHDRQTDLIVGTMGLVLALMLHAVLLNRYSQYYYLLRLDLVALVLFVLSSAIVLFGLRPVIRFAWVWVMCFMVFPLPYLLTVILLGGNRIAAGMTTLIVAAVATGIGTGRTVDRGFFASVAAWGVGLATLGLMAWLFPDAPLAAFQFIPTLTAVVLVMVAVFFGSRRGRAKRLLERRVEPLAASQVWSALPVVLAVAIALSLVRVPDTGFARVYTNPSLRFDAPPAAPPGWHVAETVRYEWVTRLYGRGSALTRQLMVQDVGEGRYDKFARPRTLVVDTTVTRRPFSLNTYPPRLIYRLEGARLSPPEPVDLGSGVTADLFSAVDDRILVTWEALLWTWSDGELTQRVLVVAVDNHEDWAPFPRPTGAVGPTLASMLTILFRGNAAETDTEHRYKDDELLTGFGRALVRAQLQAGGAGP